MSEFASTIRKILENVPDPEVPAISVVDLGIIREVIGDPSNICVHITPTYSGCPAMYEIEKGIISELKKHGFDKVEIKTVFSPAWTTDWMSDEAKEKLQKYGIAPPGKCSAEDKLVPFPTNKETVCCPFCTSSNTTQKSEFGATACKAMYYCDNCQQPFEYFKTF